MVLDKDCSTAEAIRIAADFPEGFVPSIIDVLA
jgi:hypothetical protein